MSKETIKSMIGCFSIPYIAVTSIIMLICFFSCDDKKQKETTQSSTRTIEQKRSDSDLARRKRIAKWIRECDDREWRNSDGNIAIKKAARHFGISESEAMSIALEGLKNGW